MSVKVPTQPPEKRERSRRGGPDLCTISLEIELVTPILGGGYQTRSLDDVEVIRAATVRGHLRFWWRALFGHTHTSATALYDAEGTLWGRAATEQGEGVERGGRSQVEVRVDVQRDGDLDSQPIRLHSSKDGQKTPGAYALWPAKEQAERKDRAAVPTAPRRKAGTRFKLSLFAPKKQEDELRNVVRAWLLFGGYGSRTRRGLGSFSVVEKAAWLPKDATHKAIEVLFGYDIFTATSSPAGDVPWLAGASLQVGKPDRDASRAWTTALDWLNEFRQGTRGSRDRAREPGGSVQPNRPSISNWPEADKVRRLSKQKAGMPWAHSPNHNNTPAWPRAGFGLPILGQFQDKARDGRPMDEPGPFELRWRSPKPKLDGQPNEYDEHDRLASPLIVKALPLADGTFVPCALWLNRGLPNGAEVGLLREKEVDPLTVAPFDRLVARGDTARFSALVGKKDLREAFLAWLAKQHKTTVVAP